MDIANNSSEVLIQREFKAISAWKEGCTVSNIPFGRTELGQVRGFKVLKS